MNDIALEFNHVWKKFKKGEKYDSLRDLIPAMTKRLFTKNNRGELQEKEFWAVKDVSFEVKRGEALGIIGPNGAGKSTILKLLSGILRPNKGDIKVNGRMSALIEVGAGFHPDLTGRENIYLNGAILGMKKVEIDKKFNEIVEFSGITEFIDTPVKRYSSGMNARLGFSIAAHVDPDILLVDEVLAVGDFTFRTRCYRKMEKMVHSGIPMIVVSHDMNMISRLCTSAICLRKGEKNFEGKPSEVVSHYLEMMRDSKHADGSTCEHPDAKIISVNLIGEEGYPIGQVFPGQQAMIRINARFMCHCPDVNVGMNIMDEQGNYVFGTSLARLRTEVLSVEPGTFATVNFKLKFNLGGGRYYVGAAIMPTKTNCHWEYRQKALDFLVVKDARWDCIVNCEPTVEIQFFKDDQVCLSKATGVEI